MSNNDVSNKAVQDLLDREAIRECLYRYCRGVDRGDETALRATYWDDATDRHGPYQGAATGFCDWALDMLKTPGRGVHLIGNIMIELHGDQALAESYFHAVQEDRKVVPGAVTEVSLYGRYIDRFEKRDGEWKVAARTVVYDWSRSTPVADSTDIGMFGSARRPLGARCPDDTFYEVRADILARRAAEPNDGREAQ
ncbi:nuclear transport factor 2 family protein [Burkholderia sp. Bp8963]|uniref:nuclear transport factor 2 family protein n=1 Tax=Burkholderia sp. Bp8963 TaxID=2184547 RepID=UPI000F594144|nr:nuclear transport factor 2 family protein [Burkholderia sp. Bp8963]RQS68175.1 nuclear transport factor 2 family protein [Burkholderia sp. Bp8963]